MQVRVLHQRVRLDSLSQILLVPRIPVDRADHSECVAGRGKEDRDGASHDQRALVQGLVIVAVEEDEVTALQERIGDDLVGCARAVQNEVGSVGPEHARRVFLRLRRRPLVDQHVAEVDIRVAEDVAKYAFAEVLEEQLSRG